MTKLTLDELCTWRTADRTLPPPDFVAQAFQAVGLDPGGLDLFGDKPSVRAFDGNVERSGDLHIESDNPGIYVIEGKISVDGTFTFSAADAYTVLVVKGGLTTTGDCIQAMDTQLVILGGTTIGGVLWIDVSDAGFTVLRGRVRAARWHQANDSVASSFVVDAPPEGRQLEEGPELDELRERFAM